MRRGSSHYGDSIITLLWVVLISGLVFADLDQESSDSEAATNNDCYFKKGGSCIHKNGVCPLRNAFPEPPSEGDCPPNYFCCVSKHKEPTDDNDSPQLIPQCGINSLGEESNRIFGGWRARSLEYPWMVLLRLNQAPECGGSIIAPRWILTAAHCFNRFGDPDSWSVTVGEYDLLRLEKGNQFMQVEKIIRHPNYHEKLQRNDIALLKLTRDIQLTEAAQPICLPKEEDNFVGKVCVVAGWGYYDDYERPSQFMQVLNVPIVPGSQCSKTYKNFNKTYNFCAGYNDYGRDACRGDSGGPLMCKSIQGNQKTYALAGVVSYGTFCATNKYLGVYTKVSHFVSWINHVIESD